jgi:hypothetical protein
MQRNPTQRAIWLLGLAGIGAAVIGVIWYRSSTTSGGTPQSETYRGVSIASAYMAPSGPGNWSYEINGPADYPLALATFRGSFDSSAAALVGGQAEVDQQYAGGWKPS